MLEKKKCFWKLIFIGTDIGYQFITKSRIFTDEEYKQLLEEKIKIKKEDKISLSNSKTKNYKAVTFSA